MFRIPGGGNYSSLYLKCCFRYLWTSPKTQKTNHWTLTFKSNTLELRVPTKNLEPKLNKHNSRNLERKRKKALTMRWQPLPDPNDCQCKITLPKKVLSHSFYINQFYTLICIRLRSIVLHTWCSKTKSEVWVKWWVFHHLLSSCQWYHGHN